MKIKFIGNPQNEKDTAKVCETMGKVFVLGQEVDISDLPEAQRKKLAGNHHFEVVGGVKRGRKPKETEETGEE